MELLRYKVLGHMCIISTNRSKFIRPMGEYSIGFYNQRLIGWRAIGLTLTTSEKTRSINISIEV